MKKVLSLLLASALVLGACGNSEESKSDDKKETKSSSNDDKKKDENKKSNDDKKESSNKEDAPNDDKQQANTEQPTQNVEQPQSTQEPVQSQEQNQEPTDQEKMEANAKVAKEHGYTGIPNGDAHSDVPVGQIELTPEELAKEEAKPEYQDVVETEEESDWVKGQDEWMNASESERTEIRKADAEKYGYEYDPTDYE